MKINFGIKKEISKVLFQFFGEMEVIGCMPTNLAVDFDDSSAKLHVTLSMVLQNSTLGEMETTVGAFDISYYLVEQYLEKGCAWYAGCEIWEHFQRLAERDIKWLVEGETTIHLSDEEMEEKIKESEEN